MYKSEFKAGIQRFTMAYIIFQSVNGRCESQSCVEFIPDCYIPNKVDSS